MLMIRAGAKRLTSRFLNPPGRVLHRCFSTDKEIEEFNQELVEVFGASSCTDFQPTMNKSPIPSSSPSSQSPRALTHVDESGKASMVDVSEKKDSRRKAVARGRVLLGPDVFQLVASNRISKGDVLTVARVAGIQAAKQTPALIPLCHHILLSSVKVDLELDEASSSVGVSAEASSVGQTGVEMEALTAVSVACLTIYDMCKAASKSIEITGIQLHSKSGGKSGEWLRGTDSEEA